MSSVAQPEPRPLRSAKGQLPDTTFLRLPATNIIRAIQHAEVFDQQAPTSLTVVDCEVGIALVVLRHPEDAQQTNDQLLDFLTAPGSFVGGVPELRVTTPYHYATHRRTHSSKENSYLRNGCAWMSIWAR